MLSQYQFLFILFIIIFAVSSPFILVFHIYENCKNDDVDRTTAWDLELLRYENMYGGTAIRLPNGCIKITNSEMVVYLKDEEIHREDGPAIEYNDGSYAYLIDGKFHREDGPALHQKQGPSNSEYTKFYFDDCEVSSMAEILNLSYQKRILDNLTKNN